MSEFKAIEKKIYYGLAAVKNVGSEAISNIINEREKNGKFKSLKILLKSRTKDVNKLQLEGLTKAGVFDELEKDRNKIFNSIPKIIQKIKIINEDKINNQSSLFDNSENFSKSLIFYLHLHGVKKNYYLKNLNLWVSTFLIIH